MNVPATRLQMDARRTTLTTESAAALVVAIGYGSVAEKFFRHDPPTPGELERAIDAVEHALMDARAQRAEAGTLVIADDTRRRLPALLPEATTTIDEVEARFQRLASASLGNPVALVDGPPGSEVAAALLILRECMHHLGYARVVIDAAPAGAR